MARWNPYEHVAQRRQCHEPRAEVEHLATVDSPTSSVLRNTIRVLEQLDDVVNDIVNFAAAHDAPGLEGKYPLNELLHSFEVHYPIRFPRFTTVG